MNIPNNVIYYNKRISPQHTSDIFYAVVSGRILQTDTVPSIVFDPDIIMTKKVYNYFLQQITTHILNMNSIIFIIPCAYICFECGQLSSLEKTQCQCGVILQGRQSYNLQTNNNRAFVIMADSGLEILVKIKIGEPSNINLDKLLNFLSKQLKNIYPQHFNNLVKHYIEALTSGLFSWNNKVDDSDNDSD